MTGTEQLREDMAYVRAAADRAGSVHVPAIYILWAAISLCGFTLADVVTDYRLGVYWMIAGPAGFCVSMWLGRRAGSRAGQADRRAGSRWGLHWLGFMAAGILGSALVATGHLSWAGFSSLWVLLVALTYFQAGVHLDRRMLPVGVAAAGCYLVTLFVPGYGWTAAGVVVAAVLTAQAFLGVPTRAPAH